jgi:hypothetical protein
MLDTVYLLILVGRVRAEIWADDPPWPVGLPTLIHVRSRVERQKCRHNTETWYS